jgi:hypothetical protein
MRYTRILRRGYLEEKPFVNAKISILNPQTGAITTFNEKCWVDTGFSGGIHVPIFRRSEASMVGVTPRYTSLTLAGGVRVPGYVCYAYLVQIEDHDLPSPGLETELIMQGNLNYGLVGLDVLKRWIITFNGPAQILEFYES